MVNDIRRSYLLLHLSVIFWSFTAILGGLITLSAIVLVWWRVFLTSGALLFWPGIIQQIKAIEKTDLKRYVIIGVLIALHWVSFYGSIKLANASVALITLSTTAFFTAIIEPILFKTKMDKIDIGMSLLVIPAMILTTYDFDSSMYLGFWIGLVSAILLALSAVLNRQRINLASSESITLIEMGSACLFLSICSPLLFVFGSHHDFLPTQLDFVYLLILALLCTILPFIMHLKALKHVSAFTTNLMFNLEPVYGIILAILILNEHKELTSLFYVGVILISVIVFAYPLLKRVRS